MKVELHEETEDLDATFPAASGGTNAMVDVSDSEANAESLGTVAPDDLNRTEKVLGVYTCRHMTGVYLATSSRKAAKLFVGNATVSQQMTLCFS